MKGAAIIGSQSPNTPVLFGYLLGKLIAWGPDRETARRRRCDPPRVPGDRHVSRLETDRPQVQFRDQAQQRRLVGVGHVPDPQVRARRRRRLQLSDRLLVAEVDHQVDVCGRHHEYASRADVIREVANVGGRRDDERLDAKSGQVDAQPRQPRGEER